MAEKLPRSRKRFVQSGWLLAVVLAATTLLWFAPSSHNSVTPQHSITPQITTPIAPVSPVSAPNNQPEFAARSIPLKIVIPAIGVSSKIMQLGLENDGSLSVPPDGSLAGWYSGSPTPGEEGPSVIVAHVDWKGKEGVFFRLKLLKIGDRIQVVRTDGTTASFQVTRSEAFFKKAFPSDQIYGNIDHAGLRLITCGDFDFKLHKYVKDIVVFADAVK
jgi:LPXTG-site transpeptidase (sortase) family protein